jgi:galactokinase
MSDIETHLVRRFRERFDANPAAIAWAPGRVNIIGEHTDYNGGFALPMAIGRRVYAAATPTGDETITLRSANVKGEIVFSAKSIEPAGDWGDYPKGVVAQLLEDGCPISGFNAFFLSNLPIGAGVGSSAAIEVVVCFVLQKLFRLSISPEESALLCQRAEHEFGATKCGIMDQFVSVAGSSGNALLLDCSALKHRHVPLSLGEFLVVACDSRVGRELADSEYNRRRQECERGADALSKRFGAVKTLCDATPAQLEQCSKDMPELIFRRCRHVVTENARALTAVEAMEQSDPAKLGKLMNESHDSLRDDFEVSCPQLDLLVDTARGVDGVLGSRLTGAGFGGSTISLVHRSAIDTFQSVVAEAYLSAFDTVPRFFECVPSNGAGHR